MDKLAHQKCVPCQTNLFPLKGQKLLELYQLLGPSWKIVEEHHLEKEYRFSNFTEALAFTNKVGAIAEAEGHHPDIFLSYGKVKITFWTHKINGLTKNDFIIAAKCDIL